MVVPVMAGPRCRTCRPLPEWTDPPEGDGAVGGGLGRLKDVAEAEKKTGPRQLHEMIDVLVFQKEMTT